MVVIAGNAAKLIAKLALRPRCLCLIPLLAAALLLSSSATAQSIAGTVFEDQTYAGGAGRSMATAGAGAVAVSGATVELYSTPGGYIRNTTTSAAGAYTFAGLTNGTTYVVRVVNSTVLSKLAGSTAADVGVQTYRTNCLTGLTACPAGAGNSSPVTDHVGGQLPAAADVAAVTVVGTAVPAGAQSITSVAMSASTAFTGVDFGFNFYTIVNINASGQGSLNQFITNVNALTPPGALSPSANFMIPDGTTGTHPGMSGASQFTTMASGYKVFVINAGGAAPAAVTRANVTIDAVSEITNLGGNPNTTFSLGSNSQCGPSVTSGTTYLGTSKTTLPAWTGSTLPIVEIQNAGDNQWTFSGSGDEVGTFAFHQATVLVNNSNVTVQNNLVGMHADGTISTPVSGNFGIQLNSGSGRQILHNFVRINDSDIRNQSGSTGDTYRYNEVTSPLTVQTNTFDGILLVSAAFSNDVIQYNYAHDLAGGGIEVGFGSALVNSNELIDNNTVCSNGWKQTGNPPYSYSSGIASTESVNIAIWSVAQGSTFTISHNVITNSSGAGILIENAYGFTITQNSIYSNGASNASTGNYYGLGIALFPNCTTCDPNNFSTTWTQTVGAGNFNGVLPNQGTESPTAPNYQMNYPVITYATYNANILHLKGYVGGATELAIANAKIELFVANNADNNQNGNIFAGDGQSVPHGEGQTYIGTFNADATGNFDVQIPQASFPPGVVITVNSTLLTATATDTATGSTSEFGPDVTVLAAALTVNGYVYLDVNHNGMQDLGETWQNGGATLYVSLWNGATQIGATQTIPTGASNDYGFYSFNNLPNAGGTYTIVLSTTATPASTASAGLPAGYFTTSPTSTGTPWPVITFSFTTSTQAVANQNFGIYHGTKLSGELFVDNGAGGGTANDGILNGAEPGISGVTLTAKDSSATPVTLDTETTGGGGTFTLWIPSTTTVPVKVTLANLPVYSFSGNKGAVSPVLTVTYTAATATFTASPTLTAGPYTGINLGFINGNGFAPNGALAALPGSFALYSHVLTASTGGTVTFTEALANSQPNYFGEMLYLDPACSGNLAGATYLAWSSGTATVPAGGGKICILMKESVSAQATFNMQNAVTITATFAYTGSVTLPNTTMTVQDVTTVGTPGTGTVTLVKGVFIDTACSNATGTFVTTATTAASGQCIKYQIQATNTGATPVSGLAINDETPAYTTYKGNTSESLSNCTGLSTGTVTATAGAVQGTFTGIMPPGCVAALVYEVTVN